MEESRGYGGPFKATHMWNDVTRDFRGGMSVSRHRLQLRSYPDSFTGPEAVSWLLEYLRASENFGGSAVTRKQASLLLVKLQRSGLFEDVRGEKFDLLDVTDTEGRLFRFTNCALEDLRLPLANRSTLLNRSANQNARRCHGDVNEETADIKNKSYRFPLKMFKSDDPSYDIENLPPDRRVGDSGWKAFKMKSEPRSSSEQRKKIKEANNSTAALSGTSHMSAKRSQSSAPSVENVLVSDQSEKKDSNEDLNLACIERTNKQNHTNKKPTCTVNESSKKLCSSPSTERKGELVVDGMESVESQQHGGIESNGLVEFSENKSDLLNDSLNIQVPSLEEGKFNMRDVFKFSDSERKSAKIKFSSQAKENIQSDLNIYEERAVDCEVSSYSIKKSNEAEATKNKNKIVFNETVVFDKKQSKDPFKRLFGGVVNKISDSNPRFDALPDQFDKSALFKRKNSSRTRNKKGQYRRSAGAVLVTGGIFHDGFSHGGISSDNFDFLNEHMQDAWNVMHCPGYATDVQAVKKSSREKKLHKKTNEESARRNDTCKVNSVHFTSKSLSDESKHVRRVGQDFRTMAWDGNGKYSDSSVKANSGSTHITNNAAKIEKYSDGRKYCRYSVESLINSNNSNSFYANDNNYDVKRNEGRNFVIVGSTIPRNNVEKLHTSSKSFDIVNTGEGKVNINKTRSDFPTTLTYYRRTDSRSHSVDNRKVEDSEANRVLLRGRIEDYVVPTESSGISERFDVMAERNGKIRFDNELQNVEKRENDNGVMHKSRSKSKREKVAKPLENPLRENFMKENPMMKKHLENPMMNKQLDNPLMKKPMISRLLMERQCYILHGNEVNFSELTQGLNAGLEQSQESVTKSTKKNGGIIRDRKPNHVSFGSNTSQLSGVADWNFTGDSSTLQASNIFGINQSLNNSNGKRDSFMDRQSDCSLEVSQAEISQLLPLARKLLPEADEHCLEVAVQQTIIERQRARSQSLSSRDRSVSVSKRNSSVVEGKTFGAIVETENCEEKCCEGCDRKSAGVLDDVKRRVCKEQLVKRLEKMVSRKDTLSKMINMDAISADSVARNLKIALNGDCGATYHADSNDKGKEDTLPEWLVEALKCLAKWPESDVDGTSCVGFEEELLKVVTDYLSIQDPLFNDSHYKFLIKILESISRDSMSTLTSVMKCPHQQCSHKQGLSPVSYQIGLSDSTVIQLNMDTPASLTENRVKTSNTSTDLISIENKSVQGQYCINKEYCSHNQDVLPHYQHVNSEDNLVTADAALLSTSLKNLNGHDGNKAARNVLKGSVEVEGLARKKEDSKPLIKRRSLSVLIGLRKRRDKSKRTWEKLTSNDALDSTRDIDQKSISIPDLAQLALSMPDISQINTDNSDKLSLTRAQSTKSDECERKAKQIAKGIENSDDMPDVVKTVGIKRKLSARNSNTSGSVEENFVNKEASALNINKIIDFLDPNSPKIVDFATAFGPGYRFDATVDSGMPVAGEIKEERHRWHFPSLKRSRSRKRNNVITGKVVEERGVEASAETAGEACGDVKNLKKSKSESSGLLNEKNDNVLKTNEDLNFVETCKSISKISVEGISNNTHADSDGVESHDLSEGFTNFVHINPSKVNTEEFYPTLSYRKKSISGFGAGNRIGSLRKPGVTGVGLSNLPNDLIGDLKGCEEFSSKFSLEIEEPLLLAETDYSELMKCLDNLCLDRVVSPKDTCEKFTTSFDVEENKNDEINNVVVKQKEGVYYGMESNLTNISEGIYCAKFEGGDRNIDPIKKPCHELALQYSMGNRGDTGKVKRSRSRYSKWNAGSKPAQKQSSSSSGAMKCDTLYSELVTNSNGNAPVTENIISSDLVTNSDKNASEKCGTFYSELVTNSNENSSLNSATLMSEDNFEESDNLVELLSILAHMCEVCKPLENQDFCEIFWRCVEAIQLCSLVLEPRAYERFMSTLRLFGKVYGNRNLAMRLGAAADNKLTSYFFSYRWMKVSDDTDRYGNETVADRYGNETVAETLLEFLLLHHSKITRSPSRQIRLVEEAIQREVTDGCHPVSCCLDTQPDQNNKLASTYRVSTFNQHPSYLHHRFECLTDKENILPSEDDKRLGIKSEPLISSTNQCKLMHQTGSILSQTNQQTGTNQSTGNGKSLEEEKIKKRRSRTPSVLKKPLLHLQSMRF